TTRKTKNADMDCFAPCNHFSHLQVLTLRLAHTRLQSACFQSCLPIVYEPNQSREMYETKYCPFPSALCLCALRPCRLYGIGGCALCTAKPGGTNTMAAIQ